MMKCLQREPFSIPADVNVASWKLSLLMTIYMATGQCWRGRFISERVKRYRSICKGKGDSAALFAKGKVTQPPYFQRERWVSGPICKGKDESAALFAKGKVSQRLNFKGKGDSAALFITQNGFSSETFSFPTQDKINFVTARSSCNCLKLNVVDVSELQFKQRPQR